jgi:hypothetical protein
VFIKERHIKGSNWNIFVCLFIAARAIFQLPGGCHHYRWQGCKFRPMFCTSSFYHWGYFLRATPTATGTMIYRVSSERAALTTNSGIRTRYASSVRSLHRYSNHYAGGLNWKISCNGNVPCSLLLKYLSFYNICLIYIVSNCSTACNGGQNDRSCAFE